MDCNATIEVGGEVLACEKTKHPDRNGHHNIDAEPGHWLEHAIWKGDQVYLIWNDEAPGTTPHQDPDPKYQMVKGGERAWDVVDDEGRLIASFWPLHPDAENTAEAHAEFLNGDGGPELAARVVLQRLHRAEEEVAKCHEALEKAYVREGDLIRFRKALEKLAIRRESPDFFDKADYARRVLNGEQP